MKHILIIILSILLLFSCEKEEKVLSDKAKSISELKKEKAKQEKVKDSISKIIIGLESDLAKLDTIKKLTLVNTLEIKPTHFEHFISLQGNTKTDNNITVRPVGSGLITGVYVKEGERVYTGQKLFQLDNSVLKNSIYEVKNQLSLAQTTFERQQRLWNQKIGSEMQFLQAKNNKEALENKIKTLSSQLKNYRVTASFSGIVDDLIVTKGDLASPQTPLAQIVNLSNMYIESDVPESFLKSIKKGSKVIVSIPTIGKEVKTKITLVGNTISPANRTFKVRINIPNKKGKIKSNLLADIKIKDFEVKDAIVIPSRLVQIDENGNNFVFTVVEKEGKSIVVKRSITVKSTYNNNSFISEGLTLEDILINKGVRNVSEGQKVELIHTNLVEEKRIN